MNHKIPLTSLANPTIDWKKRFERYKTISAFIAFLLSCIAFFLSYSILEDRLSPDLLQKVFVAQTSFDEHRVISSDMIEEKLINRNLIPLSAITDTKDIIGKFSQHRISKNEIITDHAVKELIRNNSLVSKIESDHSAFSVTENWFEAPFPEIQEGDYLDIYNSFPKQEFLQTQKIVSRIKVLDITQSSQFQKKKTLTLELDEKEIRELLYSHTNKAHLIIILSR